MSLQSTVVIIGFSLSIILYIILRIIFENRLKIFKRITNIIDEKNFHTEEDPYSLPFNERIIKPLFRKIEKSIVKWTPYSFKKKEQQLLTVAGYPHHLTFQEWITVRTLIWLAIGGSLTYLSLQLEQLLNTIAIIIIGWFLGYYLPIFYLKRKSEERKNEISKELPYVLDILTVSVEAGLGFDAALAKVVEKINGTLAYEFNKTLQEIKMGKARKEALKNLGERTGVDEMMQFVTSIVQADQLGVRLGNVLRVQSEDMREKRKQRAEEKAMKAPIKILFPLILFIFPAIFIVILGPAIINLMDTFFK